MYCCARPFIGRIPVQHVRPECFRGRRAFTLLELLAALSLTGLVLLGAWRLLEQLAVSRDALTREDARVRGTSNGLRVLQSLTRQAESGDDSGDHFAGTASVANFWSWCSVPSGWLERCHVTFTLSNSDDSCTLVVTTQNSTPLTLWRSRGAATLLYLDENTAPASWRADWANTITIPAAVGIATETDTIVLLTPAGS